MDSWIAEAVQIIVRSIVFDCIIFVFISVWLGVDCRFINIGNFEIVDVTMSCYNACVGRGWFFN